MDRSDSLIGMLSRQASFKSVMMYRRDTASKANVICTNLAIKNPMPTFHCDRIENVENSLPGRSIYREAKNAGLVQRHKRIKEPRHKQRRGRTDGETESLMRQNMSSTPVHVPFARSSQYPSLPLLIFHTSSPS